MVNDSRDYNIILENFLMAGWIAAGVAAKKSIDSLFEGFKTKETK